MNNATPHHGEPAPADYSWTPAPYFPQDHFKQATAANDGGWDFMRKVWRRKGLVMALTAALVVIGILLGATLTPRYAAETRVLVGVEQARITNVESILKGLTANSETVASEAYVIASQDVASVIVWPWTSRRSSIRPWKRPRGSTI
jgi:hypothetical protein